MQPLRNLGWSQMQSVEKHGGTVFHRVGETAVDLELLHFPCGPRAWVSTELRNAFVRYKDSGFKEQSDRVVVEYIPDNINSVFANSRHSASTTGAGGVETPRRLNQRYRFPVPAIEDLKFLDLGMAHISGHAEDRSERNIVRGQSLLPIGGVAGDEHLFQFDREVRVVLLAVRYSRYRASFSRSSRSIASHSRVQKA